MSEPRKNIWRGRILPREEGAAPLDVVIGVMALLAALTLGASLIAHRAAEGWQSGLASKLTVQILPPAHGEPGAALNRETGAALAVLRATDGIVRASAVSEADTLALVEPWLGKGALVADLPLPRLIDADIVPGARVDLVTLSQKLKAAAPDSLLDDHTHWIARLKSLTDGVVWSAYAILALIAIATAAAVSFATRAGLEAHHDIVALLHGMGAHAGFIARAFERHYFLSALSAAAAGAAIAGVLFLAASGLEMAGFEAVPFLPPLSLKFSEVAWLAIVPLASALIAWATARLSVLAALRRIY
jgi:cell division transport system permease protein